MKKVVLIMVNKLQAPRQCAFTLIELLVVISIIALLVSILMPALKNARDMAKTAVCASLMKQWAFAVTGYASENNDEIPAYAHTLDNPTGGALDYDTMWYNLLSSYMGSAYTASDIKWGYAESRRCPAGRGSWGEKSASIARKVCDASRYRGKLPSIKIAWGQRRLAVTRGMPECKPKALASYEAAATTPRRSGRPPTTTGLPLSSGLSVCSTETKKASRSTCIIRRVITILGKEML